ncbi:MAG: peptidylprolyl isomerase [bacterium]|jgi:cyclophilin family peptidyl-prolyl cis-trans isomerase|nr:peptidylprolyl isomerase [bacterium]
MKHKHQILILLLALLLAASCSQDRREYRAAMRSGNPRLIGRYIEAAEDAKLKARAETRLERMYYQRANTEDACIRYLANYPEGKYVEKIRDKMEELTFERAKASIFAAADYIEAYPQGKYRGHEAIVSAEAELEKLTRPLTAEEIEAKLESVANTPAEPVSADEYALIETRFGVMKMRFFPDKAPGHCANFKRLANAGYYDGVTFHRVIPGFMIQGGDILSRDGNKATDGTGGPGYTIDAEFNDVSHVTGIVSMARTPDPNSAGSQFFICDGSPTFLDRNYTVFGEIVEGKDIINKIANVQRDGRDNPLQPVYIRVTMIGE